MVLYTASRRNTFVGGTCALPSVLLISCWNCSIAKALKLKKNGVKRKNLRANCHLEGFLTADDIQWNFYRAMLCTSAAYAMVRCPSVCPSVTFMYCMETNERVLSCHLLVAPAFLFCARNIMVTFRQSPPLTGASNACMKYREFSTSISLYLRNDIRYGHSYNVRRIGTRMRSIEWYHFQWPRLSLRFDVWSGLDN